MKNLPKVPAYYERMNEKEQDTRKDALENNAPLVVLRYEPWRILWRLLFPCSIVMPVLYMIVFHWAPRKSLGLMIVSQILGLLMLFGGILLILEMFLAKDFRLYRDRVVKRYWLFGKKEVFLDGADVTITDYTLGKIINVRMEHTLYLRLTQWVFFDCNLGNRECMSGFVNACQELGIVFKQRFGAEVGETVKNKNDERRL